MSEETTDYAGVICPKCGHFHSDSWEWFTEQETVTVECESCGATMNATASTSVVYSAELAEA